LIDPHASPLRVVSRNLRDLMASALHNWVLAFDNISSIPLWLSDALCVLATGGSFAGRKLFDNDQEHHWSVQRPVIITGIGDLALKPDLMDRSLFLELPPIPDERRQRESTFWEAFYRDYPLLLGALLDVVAGALRLLPDVSLGSLPRMADSAHFGEAACRAAGYAPGAFLSVRRANCEQANRAALEDSPVPGAILEALPRWGRSLEGTATELLDSLMRSLDERSPHRKRLPRSPGWLSAELRRAAPQLRMEGVIVTFGRSTTGGRIITIEDRRPPSDEGLAQ
jgi:hypothetical protein